jgi:hypothetical protein
MKVFELLTPQKLEPKDTEVSARDNFDRLNRGQDDRYGAETQSDEENGIERLGSGLFGTAYSTKEEPGTANKVVRPASNLGRDGYYQYMKMLASHKEGSDNRYFPRVYDVEVFKSPPDPNQRYQEPYTYKVEMERLHRFSDLSVEEMMEMGNKLFSNFQALLSSYNQKRKNLRDENKVRDKIGAGKRSRDEHERLKIQKQKVLFGQKGEEEYSRKFKSVVEDAFFDAIRTAMEVPYRPAPGDKGPATNIKDPELKRALIVLRGFIKKSRKGDNDPRGPDIHGGNIMVRRGPFAPQLVFTDPVV